MGVDLVLKSSESLLSASSDVMCNMMRSKCHVSSLDFAVKMRFCKSLF